jgi:4a-hydroxytetrahydrobiopterin dehydratase
MSLRSERCQACTAETPLLDAGELARLRTELDGGWEVIDGSRLRRTVATRDFAESMALAVHCGMVAEQQGHHPDLTVAWGRLDVVLWTHVAGGLTRADVVLASHLDSVLGD